MQSAKQFRDCERCRALARRSTALEKLLRVNVLKTLAPSAHKNATANPASYAYALNNPLSIIDPTGLYDLVNTCASDDKKCNKQFQQDGKNLKQGLQTYKSR